MKEGVTKAQEIEAIKALIGMDGYFADFFKRDLGQMIENIKNDFPIEFDTCFNNAAAAEVQKSKELKKQHKEKVNDLCSTLLCVYAETGSEQLYERALQELGINNLIKLKKTLGLSLNNKETDYLISLLP